MAPESVRSLLLIKHGAFGDVIKAMGACRAVRQRYANTRISLLTTEPYHHLCSATGYFDHIFIDSRSRNPIISFLLLKQLARQHFDLVIDFQNSRRTNRYFNCWRFFNTTPWCGTAVKCQYPISMDLKKEIHIYDRFAHQLQLLGLNIQGSELTPSLEWIANNSHLVLPPSPYALLIPGSSKAAIQKRWPVESYADVAKYLSNNGIIPVIIGGPGEHDLVTQIQKVCPDAYDMTKKTSLIEVGIIAKHAALIIGNDTGPTYLASASGQPTIVLWSNYSNPLIHAPRGDHIMILQQDNLADLDVQTVIDAT